MNRYNKERDKIIPKQIGEAFVTSVAVAILLFSTSGKVGNNLKKGGIIDSGSHVSNAKIKEYIGSNNYIDPKILDKFNKLTPENQREIMLRIKTLQNNFGTLDPTDQYDGLFQIIDSIDAQNAE